ncbi:MAG: Na+/H+ antiporter subunit B [Bacteriovoracaceae bacterium]|nr:Na+/H+ antiporter subunit B [Bacteriovoracaceae bacterium]
MKSVIFSTAIKYLIPLLLLFSLFLLVSGHDTPGGGFCGGLLAAAALSLYAMASDDTASVKKMVKFDPINYIGVGLLLAAGSGFIPLLMGEAFMTGTWTKVGVEGSWVIPIGTPVVFDIGVYLVVFGVTLLVLLSLVEENRGN